MSFNDKEKGLLDIGAKCNVVSISVCVDTLSFNEIC